MTRPRWGLVIPFFLFSIVFFNVQTGRAQWRVLNKFLPPTRITDPPPGFAADSEIWITSIYFLDLPGPPRIGFLGTYQYTSSSEIVGSDSSSWEGQIWKTTDGGAHWAQWVMPPNDPGFFGVGINDFVFKDSLTGWLVTDRIFGAEGTCFKTTDGGMTWNRLPGSGFAGAYSIYYQPSTDLLFEANNEDGLFSTDEGSTWQDMQLFSGCAFADDSNGITCGPSGDYIPVYENIYVTSDGGKSWSLSNALIVDTLGFFVCFHPLAIPGTKTFFIVADTTDNNASTVTNRLWRSDDGGKTWKAISMIPIFEGADTVFAPPLTDCRIFGDSQYIFIQSGGGVFVSTDQGVSWQSLCGPAYPIDIWAGDRSGGFYQNGNYIYATDGYDDGKFANLWYLNLDSLNIFSSSMSHASISGTGNERSVTFQPQIEASAAVDTVHFSLRYDSSLLLDSLSLPANWHILDSSSMGNILTVTIFDTSSTVDTPSITLNFRHFVTPSQSDGMVWLDSAHLFGKWMNCDIYAQSATASDSVQLSFPDCADSIILASMEGRPLFSIESIVPNPASNSLQVNLQSSSSVSYTIFDVLGNSQLTGTVPTVLIDVSSLAPGIYYLRLSSDGYVQSRAISIER